MTQVGRYHVPSSSDGRRLLAALLHNDGAEKSSSIGSATGAEPLGTQSKAVEAFGGGAALL